MNVTREKGKRLNLYVRDYVVFDLETTGLSPATDEIIEISGIKVRGGKAVEDFSTLVNPGRPIPFAATSVNGITNSMVKNAPCVREALGDFLDFAGGDILVGHNIHTFDTNFLYDGAVRELGKKVQNDYVDTLYMAKACLPELSHHRLTDVAAHFQIATEGAHRALNDCVVNRLCYERLGVIWEEKQKAAKKIKETAGNAGATETDGAYICSECGCVMVKRKGRF